MYGKLINGRFYEAPADLVDNDGKIIYMNFKSDIALLKQHGYKLVTKSIPEYNVETQDLYVDSYVEDELNIIINYAIKNKDIPQTEVDLLKTELTTLKYKQEMSDQALQELILAQMTIM